jgi:peptidoglycan/LPS O-acetylase OafA/YrhL
VAILFILEVGRLPSSGILILIFGDSWTWTAVLLFFLAGAIFHLYGGPTLLRRLLLLAASILMIAASFVPHTLVIALPTCRAYLVFGLAYNSRLHRLNLGRFGDFSYGTHLYAFPVQQLIVKWEGGSIAPMNLFMLAAPISLILGALSWFLVERHFLGRAARLKHEGREALAVHG